MYDFHRNKYYGKCLFLNMFCIPYKELSEIKNKTIEMEEVSQFIDDNKKEYKFQQKDSINKKIKIINKIIYNILLILKK